MALERSDYIQSQFSITNSDVNWQNLKVQKMIEIQESDYEDTNMLISEVNELELPVIQQ